MFMKLFTVLTYCGGFLLFAGGISLSFLISVIIDSSLVIDDRKFYKNEVTSNVDEIYRFFFAGNV